MDPMGYRLYATDCCNDESFGRWLFKLIDFSPVGEATGMWVGFKHLNGLNSEDSFKFLPGLNEICYLQLSMMATRKGFTLSYIYLWFTVCNVSENGMNRLNDIYVAGVGVVNPSASLTRLEKLPANTMKDRAYVYHFSHIYASTIINITVPHEISHVWCACVRVCVCCYCISRLPKDHHHYYIYILL